MKSITIKSVIAGFACLLAAGLLSCNKEKADVASEILQIQSDELSPDVHFHNAQIAFANNEYHRSSESIKKGIDAMKEIARLVDSLDRVSIDNSIAELYELSSDVYYDKVDGLEQLNGCFARAGKAVAGAHMKIVEKSYYALDGKKAASELIRAIDEIERLKGYYESGINNDDAEYLTEMKEFAVELASGKVSNESLDSKLNELSKRLNSNNNLKIKVEDTRSTDKKILR